ncbi:MFS transporter [Nonomuraea soli]|uniref:MFS family permease n=1 Tax=Nonomuraea soli TaxID=1032476 RepID=A0A7W0HRD9_9ACTN|nr:MFS transporter [Nonomuraea soli]MBA2892541.1 MFS family permease [Nonomuraea soli]
MSFRNLYLSAAVSQFGSQISYVALPLLAVTALDAGAAELGLLSSLATITVLVTGLPAGAWIDRVRKRPVMVTADLARAVLLGSLPLMWWLGGLTIWQLYLVAMLTGVGTLFFDVASHSVLPHIVGRDGLTKANSLLVGTSAGMDIAGRSFAGVLVGLAGPPLAIVIDAVSYLVSALFLRRLPSPAPAPGRERLGPQVAEGVRFVVHHPVLRPIALQGAMVNVGFPLMSVLLPMVIRPAWLLGLFLAVGGAGVLAGSSLAHVMGRWLGNARAVWLVSLTTTPAAFLVPFAEQAIWVAAAGWFVLTFRTGMNNVMLVSFRQRVTPDELQGRMNATMRLILMGAVGIGGLLAGVIGEAFGVTAALWAGAAVMALSWLPLARSEFRQSPVLTS